MRIVIPLTVVALVIVGLAYARLHYRATKRRHQRGHDRQLEMDRREEAEYIDQQLRKETDQ